MIGNARNGWKRFSVVTAMATLSHALAIPAFCTLALAMPCASPNVAAVGIGTEADEADHLITGAGMGRVRLKMTLNEARLALPAASFARTSDGDGVALVEISFGKDDSLTVSAEEDDRATPIDWSRTIVTIETFSERFHTAEGVHPGSLVTDVIRLFGPVREIVKSEIESREYITFARQPAALTFRLDYTGVFDSGTRRTTRFAPNAKLHSIAISSSR
jgi:hypothetical protein